TGRRRCLASEDGHGRRRPTAVSRPGVRSTSRHDQEVCMFNMCRALSLTLGLVVAAGLTLAPPPRAEADGSAYKSITGLSSANPKEGVQPTLISPGLALQVIARGTDPLENPSGAITHFGLLSDQTKTEPDENTYLVLNRNPGGPTPGYDYG